MTDQSKPPAFTPTEVRGSVLPVVGRDRGNRPLWLALSAISLTGILLFSGLEARRSSIDVPAVRPRISDTSQSSPFIPALYVPPEPTTASLKPSASPSLPSPLGRLSPVRLTRAPLPEQPIQRPVPRFSAQSAPYPDARIYSPALPPRQVPFSVSPAIVFDVSAREGGGQGAPSAITGSVTRATPAYASPSEDRANIVAQGTLIGAVLETALDSTQPGQARALVIKDVANIGEDKILIPRGSRLFGEYRGGISEGQNRAQVIWTRMVRPDGVSIDLNSPAADPLGRSGIKGDVNSHFFSRFAGALLQSTIDIGALAASRSLSNSSVIVAVPNTVQGATSQIVPQAPRPTLRVKQGTRISIFVSRDLDFGGVENAQ